VYKDADPADLFFNEKPIRIERADGRYVLSIHLPFVEKSQLDVSQKGEELLLKAGTVKRNILLPRVLLNHYIEGAKFERDRLRITFQKTKETQEGRS
jgi:arsenite-transporting ATPase